MAEKVNKDIVKELKDLVRRRRIEYLVTLDKRVVNALLLK